MSNALISVVIPVHNGAVWLPQTLDSIFSQTYQIFEIILVNDASTDDLLSVLASYSDLRLRVEHLSLNVGVSAARNHGIRLAQGQFIAFCDADDICLRNRLERQLAFLEASPDVGLCGGAFTCFDSLSDHATVAHPLTNDAIRRGLMLRNCFGLSTVMVRSSIVQKHMFNTSLRVAEDYELWIRIAAEGLGLANLPESLVRYRLHAAQASDTNSAELDQVTRKIQALYCVHLLNNKTLLSHVESESISIEIFQLAAQLIKTQKIFSPMDFRFMLAWMYRLLPKHGIQELYIWYKIQFSLKLMLDKNYLFNVFLYSFLPNILKANYISVLTKLKH